MADGATHLPPDVRYDAGDGRLIGWMAADELVWLYRQAEQRQVIVEVGAWQGRTTQVLAEATPGRVIAVDNWQGESGSPVPDLETRFRENLFQEIAHGKVEVRSMNSLGAASALRWEGIEPDMVFIDANHEYPNPLHDIYAWHAALAKGGLLCGHDYGQTGVNQSLAECHLPWATVGAGSIWRLQ